MSLPAQSTLASYRVYSWGYTFIVLRLAKKYDYYQRHRRYGSEIRFVLLSCKELLVRSHKDTKIELRLFFSLVKIVTICHIARSIDRPFYRWYHSKCRGRKTISVEEANKKTNVDRVKKLEKGVWKYTKHYEKLDLNTKIRKESPEIFLSACLR